MARVVLPGEVAVGSLHSSVAPGPGVFDQREEGMKVCVAGLLRESGRDDNKKIWVDYSAKRYVPSRNERVLGVVTKTSGRSYRVDIGSAMSATLPELAFQGATKRNKPNLQVGEIIYARVSRAHKDMEPELSCIDPSGKANGLGPIPTSGCVIHCSIGLCRKLLSSSPVPVLEALRNHFKFELTVGMNGRVWINSDQTAHTIAISNAIETSEYMSAEECSLMVEGIVERL